MMLVKLEKKMRGIFLPGIVAGVFMVGLISTTVAAITATSFSTLGATKTASQAQQFGQAEAEYIKIMGYNNYASLVHERQSMEELVGEDGAKYQSKVEVADTSTNGEGREVKVMKINVYKGNEINSRYSEEIPLVSGLDYSEKFDAINNLIDAITNRVAVLETNMADLSNRMTNAEKNINAINADLSRLEELINENADAIAANRASIDKNASDIEAINKQIVQVKGDISDLRTDLSSLWAALNQEIANRKSEDSALQSKINAVKADVASLQTSVATITGRLNGKEFVKNYSKQNNISLDYEDDEIVAYVDGTKVPLSSQGNIVGKVSDNGYIKLSNGLIVQWGRFRNRPPYDYSYPIPFPNKCFCVTLADVDKSSSELNAYVYNEDRNHFGFGSDEDGLVEYFSIIAIGY